MARDDALFLKKNTFQREKKDGMKTVTDSRGSVFALSFLL